MRCSDTLTVLLIFSTAFAATASSLFVGGDTYKTGERSVFSDGFLDHDQKEEWLIWGEEGISDFGSALAAGDLDGDGREDLAIGIPDSAMGTGSGVVLIYFARDIDELYPLYGPEDADVVIYGVDRNDKFGRALAIEDVTGDGKGELFIGAPLSDGKDDGKPNCGEVHITRGMGRLAYGRTLQIGDLSLFGHILGRTPGAELGTEILIGDLNGDSTDDYVIMSGREADMFEISEWESSRIALLNWSIEVVEGSSSMLGEVDLSQSISMARIMNEINWDMAVDPETEYLLVGQDISIGDMNGDGHDDLAFTCRHGSDGEVGIYLGGPSFPPVSGGLLDVPSGLDVTVDLGGDGKGYNTIAMGDADGDGYDDLFVGMTSAPGWDSWRLKAGQVDLYRGSVIASPKSLERNDANWTCFGEDASDRLGASLITLDIDGDGLSEVMIGSPFCDGDINTYDEGGEAFGFGFDGALSRYENSSQADFRDSGRDRDMRSYSNMIAMDIDSDGTHEVVFSSPGALPPEGRNGSGLVSGYIVHPIWDATFFGSEKISQFGAQTLMADFDLDGLDDIVIGAPKGGDGFRGMAYLYFGNSSGWTGNYDAMGDPDIVYTGPSDQSLFGTAMAVGYLNTDSYPDLIIGAHGYYDGWSRYGLVSIFTGGTRPHMTAQNGFFIKGSSLTERAGKSLIVGDFNGDNQDDLAIGASPYEPLGRVHADVVDIFFGPIASSRGTSSANVVIVGGEKEQIGDHLAAADIDNDGYDDILIGSPRASPGAFPSSGIIYLLMGRSGWAHSMDLTRDDCVKILGEWSYDRLGSAMACGDLDGDPYADILIGVQNGYGFERSTRFAGCGYIVKGATVYSHMPNGSIWLRQKADARFYGVREYENLGSSVALGDVDGDGRDDIVIGAKGWTNPETDQSTGRVSILSSKFDFTGIRVNSTSLGFISTFYDGEEAGSSLSCGDLDNDGLMDLLVGAKASDPYGDGLSPGAAYLWLSKEFFSRDIKVYPLVITDPDRGRSGSSLEGEAVLVPGEGSYTFFVSARSVNGCDDIEQVGFSLLIGDGTDSAGFHYDTSDRTFHEQITGSFSGAIDLRIQDCRGWKDGFEMVYAEFAVDIGWGMPIPEMVLTDVSTTSGDHTNYLSESFMVDRALEMPEDGITVEGMDGGLWEGWMNSRTRFNVTGISVIHSVTGIPVGDGVFSRMDLALFRPDGRRIGPVEKNGSSLSVTNVTPGEGLSGRSMGFHIGLSQGPEGSEWVGNVTVPVDVDTLLPYTHTSFSIYPDGREKGAGDRDDDWTVEVYWENEGDRGDSGLDRYIITVADRNGTVLRTHDHASSGDLVTLTEGEFNLTLQAVDHAGNIGPMTNRSVLIDLSDPVFYDPSPGEETWISDPMERLSVKVRDEGVGMDPLTARYRVYRSDVNQLSNWMFTLYREEVGEDLRLVVEPDLPGGRNHYIQWRITDALGRESLSRELYYNVDYSPPGIGIEEMGKMTFVTPTRFEIGCSIEDPLSGIDLSSIEFKIASSNEFWEANWIDAGLTGYGAAAYPEVEVLPDFSGMGYIQWRAVDRAGNLGESRLVTIYVDSTPPEFNRFSPNSTTVQGTKSVSVSAYIVESESGISLDDVEISLSVMSGWVMYGVGGYTPWRSVDSLLDQAGGLFIATSEVLLDEGPFNLVRFRVKDVAGNGWVVSMPHRIEVSLARRNLPPTPVITVRPGLGDIRQGETITLDGTGSVDPEGGELEFSWYSDLENYPKDPLLGEGPTINVTLGSVGVHHIWMVVSDGGNEATSDQVIIRVLPGSDQDEDGQGDDRGFLEDEGNWIPILLFALLLGIFIGGVLALVWRKRVGEKAIARAYEPEMKVPEAPKKELPPICPYCGEEIRKVDEYCVHCGQIFTAKDISAIRKGKRRKGGKRRDRLERQRVDQLPSVLPEETAEEVDTSFFQEPPGEAEEEELWGEEGFEEEGEELVPEPPEEGLEVEEFDEELDDWESIEEMDEFEIDEEEVIE